MDSRPSNIDLTRILRPTSNGIIGYDSDPEKLSRVPFVDWWFQRVPSHLKNMLVRLGHHLKLDGNTSVGTGAHNVLSFP